MKQKQNRSGKRAPHGSPVHTRQFGFWCTEEQFEIIHANGGSRWMRKLVDFTHSVAMASSGVARQPEAITRREELLARLWSQN